MNLIKYFIIAAFLIGYANLLKGQQPGHTEASKVCFTFDDGSTEDFPGYSHATWNRMILNHLKQENIQAAFFICGKGINSVKGDSIIKEWDKDGHLISNHTFSHKNYGSNINTATAFCKDFLKNDSLISKYTHYSKFFRFPYLKEGNTIEKRDTFRLFLKEQHYKNGYVTIDASDWYYNSRLVEALKNNPGANLALYKKVYIHHLLNRAEFYDSLAIQLTGRKINHSILLHHNLINALFLGDIIKAFKEKGWNTISAGEAFTDEIFSKEPNIIPAGESIIWALAKESGKFEKVLRYPAEDGDYEKDKLDAAEGIKRKKKK